MNTTAQFIPYSATGAFSTLVTDYISGSNLLQPFYRHPVSVAGIKAAIEERKKYPTNRTLLVDALNAQYAALDISGKVKANIEKLLLPGTFTVTTAHQPNILTGPLYFIYKILHAVALAETLSQQITGASFVPVYYMGSEDADLEELGHVYINGEKLEWDTKQTGAVGRMKVDKALIKMIDAIAGQVTIHPFGNDIIRLMKDCYKENISIEQATFKLVHALFSEFGLIVLLPDNPVLKRAFIPVMEKELTEQFSHPIVAETVKAFPAAYKIQASGRKINMFYLQEGRRDRIEFDHAQFSIHDTATQFDTEAIKKELYEHPERFSPNVILRPVFQELVLPNIAFIGGGGELAYWMELKNVFAAVQVPYPVMVLRNSFLFAEKKHAALATKLGFEMADLFKNEMQLLNELVKRDSAVQLNLDNEKQALLNLYAQLKKISGAVDSSLANHAEALQVKAYKKIEALEKKLLRAEKKKFGAQQRQLHTLKTALFPSGNLQERVENMIPFYARYGKDFIESIYRHSLSLQQEFVIAVVD